MSWLLLHDLRDDLHSRAMDVRGMCDQLSAPGRFRGLSCRKTLSISSPGILPIDLTHWRSACWSLGSPGQKGKIRKDFPIWIPILHGGYHISRIICENNTTTTIGWCKSEFDRSLFAAFHNFICRKTTESRY